MRRIERFDVSADVRSPFRDNRGRASRAAGLICQLPGKDCGRGLVAIYDEADEGLVRFLGSVISEPGGVVAAKCPGIVIDTADTVPVVDEWDDEFDALRLGLRDCIVESGNA